MEILLALILLVAVLVVLGIPLLNSRPQTQLISTGALADLEALRDGAYATLRDLDLDYQLGKLDQSDYHSLREKYMARAAAVLQELDAVRGTDSSSTLSDEIEKEVAALRLRRQTSPSVQRGRPEVEVICTNCGTPSKPSGRFCAQCGRRLNEGEREESTPLRT